MILPAAADLLLLQQVPKGRRIQRADDVTFLHPGSLGEDGQDPRGSGVLLERFIAPAAAPPTTTTTTHAAGISSHRGGRGHGGRRPQGDVRFNLVVETLDHGFLDAGSTGDRRGPGTASPTARSTRSTTHGAAATAAPHAPPPPPPMCRHRLHRLHCHRLHCHRHRLHCRRRHLREEREPPPPPPPPPRPEPLEPSGRPSRPTPTPARPVGGTARCGSGRSSPYVAYPGFRPPAGAVGEYNGKFMVNQHVLRGSARITPPGHARRTYRNFCPHARWMHAGLRIAI